MSNALILKSTPESLFQLGNGLRGFLPARHSDCVLVLADDSYVKISVWGTTIAPKFECFSLSLDPAAKPVEAMIPLENFMKVTLSVLMREDYCEAYSGDTSQLVGNNPVVHTSAKPGMVPDHALARCLVAYGFLFEGPNDRLIVSTDWFPTKIIVTTDEEKISEILDEGEKITVSKYIENYIPRLN